MVLMQTQIKRLGKKDLALFKELICVFQAVFEMENAVRPDESYLQNVLNKRDFIALAVIHKNEVIGGLTAYELQMIYGEYSELFIYDLGIKAEFQRKGLGKKLISAVKEYCKQNEIKEFFVPVNEEDKHALDFYRSTGGRAEKVVHFNYGSSLQNELFRH